MLLFSSEVRKSHSDWVNDAPSVEARSSQRTRPSQTDTGTWWKPADNRHKHTITSTWKHSLRDYTETISSTIRPQELTKHKSHRITYRICILENKSCPNLMHAKASRKAIALQDRKPEIGMILEKPDIATFHFSALHNAIKFSQMT